MVPARGTEKRVRRFASGPRRYPVDHAGSLLAAAGFSGTFSRELHSGQVESATGVHRDAAALESDLTAGRAMLAGAADPRRVLPRYPTVEVRAAVEEQLTETGDGYCVSACVRRIDTLGTGADRLRRAGTRGLVADFALRAEVVTADHE